MKQRRIGGMGGDWEDKYLTLRDEHESLKRQSNDQQRVIKQMYTKLQMIDRSMGNNENGMQNVAAGNCISLSKTESDLVKSLRSENARLKRENRELREQMRQGSGGANGSFTVTSTAATTTTSAKKKMNNLEERVKKLQQENTALRKRASTEEKWPTLENKDAHTSILKDREAQLNILRARYDQLESKARAAAEIHERTVYMMEEGNRTIRDLRRKVQHLQGENEKLFMFKQKADDLEVDLAASKEESRRLEDRLTSLCESPFINDAYESRSRIEKLSKLERDERQQKVQIEHLKETAKMHHAEIQALKSNAEQLLQHRDKLLEENQALKGKLEQLERGTNLLEDKVQIFTGDSGVDTSELEKALTMVRRGKESMSSVDFLESSAAQSGGGKKFQELQIAHLNTCRELEVAERMLKAQTNINKDLNDEITELQQRLKGSNNDLLRKLDDYETLCARRLQKIHALEAQVKQLLKKQKSKTGRSSLGRDEGDDNISIASLAVSASDFGPGENLIEVWVMSAELNEQKVEPSATTFVMMDFYDYETQNSPLLSGLKPQYNFAATYRVNVDHFFLRYMASESLTLELNRTKHGDFEMLGQCIISMRPLLQSSGKMKIEDAQIISLRDGSVLGTFKLCIRLALPIADLFEIYLREVPGEKERIQKLHNLDRQAEEEAIAKARAQNQIEIHIISCEGLPQKSKHRMPSPFIHFQLLSFPDTFSPIMQSTVDPSFDYTAPFPLMADEKLLRFLEREKLEINVLDDNEDEIFERTNDENDGFLGKAVIPLYKLARGKAISGAYPLTGEDGDEAGNLQLRIRWCSPLITFQAAKEEDYRRFSEDQLKQIIRRYEENGNVLWRRLIRFCSPKLERTRGHLQKVVEVAEQNGINPLAAFSHFDRDCDGFISKQEFRVAFEELGCNFDDGMLELLDENAAGKLSYHEFLQAAEEPTLAEIKLRRELQNCENVNAVFSKREIEDGVLTVREFCNALRDFGFRLHEHEKFPSEPRDALDFDENINSDGISEVIVGKREKAKVPVDEEIISNQACDSLEEAYNKRKRDFEERLARASQASASFEAFGHGFDDVERQGLLITYGDGAEDSAKKLQSSFREYKSRGDDTHISHSDSVLADAEDALRAALMRANGSFDIQEGFMKLDRDRSGVLSVRKFVKLLKDMSPDLGNIFIISFAKFFEQGDDQVNYNEFLRFARFIPRDISGISREARTSMMKLKAIEDGNQMDRRALGKLMAKFCPEMASFDVKAIADIFDLACDGMVDFQQVLQFAKDQPLANALYRVAMRLRNAKIDLQDIFQENASVSKTTFQKTMREVGFDLTLKETFALFNRFAFSHGHKDEIHVKELWRFVEDESERQPPLHVDLNKLQRRLQNVTRIAATAGGVTPHGAFEHYDWKREGFIGSTLFERACNITGMPIAVCEMKAIVDMFQNDQQSGVDYRRFIEWVSAKTVQAKQVIEKIRNLAERSQLLPVMEQFDPKQKGEISRGDLRKGLREVLSIREISDEEFIALFTQFDRDGDGYIQYHDFLRVFRHPETVQTSFEQESGEELSARLPKTEVEDNAMHKRTNEAPLRPKYSGKFHLLAKRIYFGARRKGFRFQNGFRGGKLKTGDFVGVLAKIDPELPIEALEDLASSLDENREGLIACSKFFELAEDTSPPVERVSTQLREMIRGQAELQGNLSVPFSHFDREKKGRFDISLWKRAVADLAVKASDVQLEAIFEQMNLSRNGEVTFAEFCVFVKDPEFAPELERKLRKLVTSRVLVDDITEKMLRKALRNSENGGVLDRYALKRFLKHFSLTLSREELVRLMRRFSDDEEGLAQVQHVSAYFERLIRLGRQTLTIGEQLKHLDVRSFLLPEVGGLMPRGKFVKSIFDAIGVDVISERDLYILADCFTFAGLAGKVDAQELLDFLDGISSDGERGDVASGRNDHKEQQGEVLNEIAEELRVLLQKARRKGVDYRQSFEHFDKNYNGEISHEEFREGMHNLGFTLTEEQTSALFEKFAGSKKHNINYRRFLRACAPGEDVIIEEVAEKFRMKLSKARDLKKVFAEFDTGETGLLSRKAFRDGLQKLDLDLTDSEVRLLLDKFDLNGDGQVSFSKFVAFAEGHDASLVPGSERKLIGAEVEQIFDQLRALVRKAHSKGVNYRQSFEHFDPGYVGAIDAGQFQEGLQRLGFDVRHEHVTLLLEKFSGQDKRVRYRDFLKAIAPQEESSAMEISDKLLRMFQRVGNLRKAFKHFQRNQDGNISRRAFKEGMRSLDFQLTDSEIRILMDMFDEDGDGFISFEDFVAFASNGNEEAMEKLIDRRNMSGSKSGFSVDFGKLKLARLNVPFERIFIQAEVPGEKTVRTAAVPCGDTKQKQSISVQTKMVIPRTRNPEKNLKLRFELVGIKESGRSKTLGHRQIDLSRDNDLQEVEFFDKDERVIAKVQISLP